MIAALIILFLLAAGSIILNVVLVNKIFDDQEEFDEMQENFQETIQYHKTLKEYLSEYETILRSVLQMSIKYSDPVIEDLLHKTKAMHDLTKDYLENFIEVEEREVNGNKREEEKE